MKEDSGGVRLNKDSRSFVSNDLKENEKTELPSVSSLRISRKSDGSITLAATGTVAVLAVVVVVLVAVLTRQVVG